MVARESGRFRGKASRWPCLVEKVLSFGATTETPADSTRRKRVSLKKTTDEGKGEEARGAA